MGWFSRDSGTKRMEITVSIATLVRVMISIVLMLVALAALNRLTSGLIILGVAFFLALALNAPVHWIATHFPGKRRGSRGVATSVAFLIVIAIIGTFLWLLVPPAVKQTTDFVQSLPQMVESFGDENTAVGNFIQRYNLQGTIDETTDAIADAAKDSGVSVITSIGGGIATTLITLVLVFMMLVEGPRWVDLGKRLVPKSRQNHAAELAGNMYRVIKGYVNGQVILAAVAAIAILIAMLIIGIPYAGALAVIVFIAALIPMIGHYIGATIVTLVALTDSVWSAIIILAFYILYQQIENYVVQPRVQANATDMSPLLVFVAVILGANFGGLLGALLAIPVMGCIRILVLDYLHSRGIISAKEEAKAIGESSKPTADTK